MNNAPPVRGVVLGHGSMAGGMVDAVRRISGVSDKALVPISNDGKSPEALKEELTGHFGGGPLVVFTDLPSGSCAVTASICCRESVQEVVILGVNLPMLLDFVFHRDLPLEELVPRLVEKGKASIKGLPVFSGREDE